ncbi:hypothetical protein EXIGLDRAFT_699605 [Exidia glandulosa HHB12029]|uniref:Myb/SANT-like domain-containing protein n=1 Tax=Exidia glandulosa HHB12029 TaxID=1314781 RepID=A0A165MFI6_EXIGL|nr:hypothetical protein EXIGLDRAFT_699605 [Exidia glandulosa HHB12029]
MPSSSSSSDSSTSSFDEKSKAPAPKKGVKCQWLTDQTAELIEDLREQKRQGNQSESGWKDSVWTVCAENQAKKFPDAPGAPKTPAKCADHYTNVKGDFKLVKELRNRSGMGWDPELNRCTASEDVWKKAIKANNKFKKFKKKSFPLYDALEELVGDIVATGEFAISLAKPSADKKDKKKDKDGKKEKKEKGDKKPSADESAPKTGEKRARSRATSEVTSVVDLADDEDSDLELVEDESKSQTKRRKKDTRRKSSGADAIHNVAGGLRAMSDTFAQVFAPPPSQPVTNVRQDGQLALAVKTVSALSLLEVTERAAAIRLFGVPENVSLFLAIPAEVEDLRAAFIKDLLAVEARGNK